MEYLKKKNETEKTKQNYYSKYYLSINEKTREKFWYDECEEIYFYKKPNLNNILDKSNLPFYKWFPDSEVNICYNCVDRHIINGYGNNYALIFESFYLNKVIKYTYNDVYTEVQKISFILKNYNIQKGDRIVIYMPTIPEAIFSMLSCCRIGAIHSVVFGGFAYSELAERIKDCKPKMIITTSCGIEPKRKIEYYPIVRKALNLIYEKDKTLGKIKILLFQREDALITPEKDIIYTDTLIYQDQINLFKNKKREEIPCIKLKSNDIFFILYTSGTSGIPKGIVRDLSSIVTMNYTMKNIMNIFKGDISFSTSDIGWIVGHVFMVYGPLLRCATTILFEGKPVGTPNSGKVWDIIQKYNVKCFYTAPTALRAIRQYDPELNYLNKLKDKIKTLESIHLSGERCDPETYIWLRDKLDTYFGKNKILINDQWWQTESGWPICCNNINIYRFNNINPGVAGPPLMGYDIKILKEDTKEEMLNSNKNTPGLICIKLPLPPGFMITLFNNNNAFIERYITPNKLYYITGDIGYKESNGFICILGRNDDMIKISGHRLSTGKIEEVINKEDEVVECAVVSKRDKLKGELPFGFIVLKNDVDITNYQYIIDKIKKSVINNIGKICSINDLLIVKNLPKTRSGKIIRALLKQIVNKDKIYIPPTIEDSKCVSDILKKFEFKYKV